MLAVGRRGLGVRAGEEVMDSGETKGEGRGEEGVEGKGQWSSVG